MRYSSQRRTHSFLKVARGLLIEGGPFFQCGSRLGAAHTRLKKCKGVTDCRRVVFKMWLSPSRRAHSC
eukprot:2990024-Pyramimonas_sp.AAC.1